MNFKAELCANSTTELCISWGEEVKSIVGGVAQPTNELYRSTNATSGFSLIYTGIISGYRDSNVIPGTIYYYKQRAKYSDSPYSDYTPVVAGTISIPTITLTTPSLFGQNNSLTTVTVAWTSVPNASYYELYGDTSTTGSFTNKLYSGLNTYYTQTGLNSATMYYYKIRAIGSGSYANSPFSPVFQDGTTMPTLATPTNLKSVTESTFEIVFSWDAVPNANMYGIYQSSSAMGTYSLISNTPNTSSLGYITNATGGLQPGTYYFKIKAWNSSNNYWPSDFAGPIALTLAPSTVPSAPTNLRTIGVTNSSVSLTWDAVSGATSYQVLKSIDSNAFDASSTTSTNNLTITGLRAGDIYTYKVRAGNSSGFGNFSSPLGVNVLGSGGYTIGTPTGLQAVYTNTGISLSWIPPSGNNNFVVYRSMTGGYWTYYEVGNTTGAATFFDSTPIYNSQYYYKIRAISKDGTQSSNFSDSFSMTFQPTL